MLTTRDLIRIRYIVWKVRAWCWLVERQQARGKLITRQIGAAPAFAYDAEGLDCLDWRWAPSRVAISRSKRRKAI